MITGEKKQQVDNIWQTFWNNGFTQPSAIFEQITYLLFMKMLDEKQLEKEAIANLTGDKLLNPTFPRKRYLCFIKYCISICKFLKDIFGGQTGDKNSHTKRKKNNKTTSEKPC